MSLVPYMCLLVAVILFALVYYDIVGVTTVLRAWTYLFGESNSSRNVSYRSYYSVVFVVVGSAISAQASVFDFR